MNRIQNSDPFPSKGVYRRAVTDAAWYVLSEFYSFARFFEVAFRFPGLTPPHASSSATAAGDTLRLQLSRRNLPEPSDCPARRRFAVALWLGIQWLNDKNAPFLVNYRKRLTIKTKCRENCFK